MIVAFAKLLASLHMLRAARVVLRLYFKFGATSLQALRELLALEIAAGNVPAQAEICGRLLETDPRDVEALRLLAGIRLSQGDPHAAAGYFRRLHEATSSEPAIIKVYRMALFDPKRYSRGEGYIATVKDVLVDTGYWSILQDDRVYYLETHQKQFEQSPLVRWRVTGDRKHYIVAHPPPTLTVDTPCIFLGGDENYSHWITRNVLKLSLLEARPPGADLPYLVNEDLQPHQREYLELLEIPEERLLRVPRGTIVQCRELTVPTVVCNRPGMKQGIAWLRAKLRNLIESPDRSCELLYVSRRDSLRRRLINEMELEHELAGLGFKTIVPGQMPVRLQVAAFAGARIIVAPHGAALANLVYAPDNVHVIEITSTNIEHMDDFRLIGQALGQRIFTVSSDDYEVDHPADVLAMHWDYRVNVEEVLAALRDNAGAQG